MKLWDKGIDINKKIEEFTIGRDRELDLLLARFDVLGSLAHVKMIFSIGLLTESESNDLQRELRIIFKQIEEGQFFIEEGIEDVHSQVEQQLTQKLGDTGKKIHSARSRNDQILLDLKLFSRSKLIDIVESMTQLFHTLIDLSEKNKGHLMPGYTHLQLAMPSSFGLWFGSYAECLADDLCLMDAAFHITNQNPLGSAAGYGSSFPINRGMTTELLGFDNMAYNVVYAQMGRGKNEKTISFALASVASTLSKMAFDICLFNSQNFGFITLPDEFTTGSSIMPHKKNPDVFELIRSKCNKIQSLTNEVTLITNNLPSGYFRDFQILKESYLQSFDYLMECIDITNFVLPKIKIKQDIIKDEKYKEIFSVEEVNRLVMKGIPFREAYKQVAEKLKVGTYRPDFAIQHTHEGSIGNLCNQQIKDKYQAILNRINKSRIEEAEKALLKG